MHRSKSRTLRLGIVLTVLFLMAPVHGETSGNSYAWADDGSSPCDMIDELTFNGTLANDSVQWQVDLGPRLPGSNASLAFRDNIKGLLEPAGWDITEVEHHRHGMNLTNLHARWASTANDSDGQVVISAHYDSRGAADRDENETNRSLPVPGANDAASGAAILYELARHIPSMNLTYDVVLFWNDAEDQGDNYTLGSEAWAENLSASEINATHAFVLLDMVGDADLQLQNINPGNDTLKARLVDLGSALGLVNESKDCNGTLGRDIIQYDVVVPVLDDHVHPHALGIPSIDIMDPVYGEPKFYSFGSYWHTMEDTPDKVSAESLGHVGRLVELGLRTDAFIDLVNQTEMPNEMDAEQHVEKTPISQPGEDSVNNGSPAMAIIAAVFIATFVMSIALLEWKAKP